MFYKQSSSLGEDCQRPIIRHAWRQVVLSRARRYRPNSYNSNKKRCRPFTNRKIFSRRTPLFNRSKRGGSGYHTPNARIVISIRIVARFGLLCLSEAQRRRQHQPHTTLLRLSGASSRGLSAEPCSPKIPPYNWRAFAHPAPIKVQGDSFRYYLPNLRSTPIPQACEVR